MALIVQKYGGTSVGSIEKIRNIAVKLKTFKEQGHDLVVVLSAMSGETDRLIRLAQEITPTPDTRELDCLLSIGEQTTVSLMAVTLIDMGIDAVSLLGFQAKIISDDVHGKARIEDVDPARIQEELAQGRIVVVAGFQGIDPNGDITTLGRGRVGYHCGGSGGGPEGGCVRNLHRRYGSLHHRSQRGKAGAQAGSDFL